MVPSRIATAQAASACNEPIDRSSPPIASASVMPSAGTEMMAAVTIRLETLEGRRKFGATEATSATTSANNDQHAQTLEELEEAQGQVQTPVAAVVRGRGLRPSRPCQTPRVA